MEQEFVRDELAEIDAMLVEILDERLCFICVAGR